MYEEYLQKLKEFRNFNIIRKFRRVGRYATTYNIYKSVQLKAFEYYQFKYQ